MPETSVHEDCRVEFRQNQVRLPWYLLCVQSKAKTSFVQARTYEQLGLGVFRSDAGHHPTSGLGIYNVRQRL
jgi:hypothetical protein